MSDGVVDAMIHAQGVETAYLRAGRGTPVLLLRAGLAGAAQDPVFGRLATRFRVISPACTAAAADGWLRDVIDALGLDRPVLAGDEGIAGLLIAFARSDPDRARGVVLLVAEPASAGPLAAVAAAPGLEPPVLCIRLGADGDLSAADLDRIETLIA